MSIAEAARKIGISASKLYQLVAERRIAHFRIGGKIVFQEADVTAYLASCRVAAVAPTVVSRRPRMNLRHIKLRTA